MSIALVRACHASDNNTGTIKGTGITNMGMAEIRDAFEAYASGELAEQELRGAIRAAIDSQPDSIPGYVAMAAALRRRQLISAELEAAVVSDMQAVAVRADADAAAN